MFSTTTTALGALPSALHFSFCKVVKIKVVVLPLPFGAVQYTSYCQKRCGEEWCRFYYGCKDSDYSNYYELSRLAVDSKEYNITSWFVSRTMKMTGADYICTSVDSRMHDGTIYSACNMNFHGSMTQRANGYMDIPFNVFSKIYRKDIKQDWEIKDLTNTN